MVRKKAEFKDQLPLASFVRKGALFTTIGNRQKTQALKIGRKRVEGKNVRYVFGPFFASSSSFRLD